MTLMRHFSVSWDLDCFLLKIFIISGVPSHKREIVHEGRVLLTERRLGGVIPRASSSKTCLSLQL